MSDERIGLSLQVDGEEQYAAAANNCARLQRELADLQSQVQRGAPGWELAQKQIEGVTRALEQAKAAARGAAGAMALGNGTATVSPGAGGGKVANWIGNNSSALSMGALQLGQFADDLQYGMRGVANQIPQLAMSFGQLAGISATASMAVGGLVGVITTLAYQAYQYLPKSAYQLRKEQEAKDAETAKVDAKRKEAEDASTVRQFESVLSDPQKKRAAAFNDALVRAGGGQRVSIALRNALEADAVNGRVNNPVFGGNDSIQAVVSSIMSGAQSGQGAAISYLGKLIPELRRPNMGEQYTDSVKNTLADVLNPDVLRDEAASFKQLMDLQESIDRALKAGNITQAQHLELTNQVTAATDRLSKASAEAANAAIAAADATEKKAKADAQARADADMRDPNSQTSRNNRAINALAEQYGGAYGGMAMQAIFRRMRNGESSAAATDAITEQLEGRMKGITNPVLRRQVADQVARQAQQMAEFQAMGEVAGGDIMRDQIQAGLAPAGTLLGRVQRSELRRQARMAGSQLSNLGAQFRQFGDSPEARQFQAGETALEASEKMLRAAEMMERIEVVL